MSKKQQRCMIYARYSPRPAKALKNCQSSEVQLEECRRYAEAEGYLVEGCFVDEEKSRDDLDRPELYVLINLLKRGWVVVVYAPDRLGAGRNAAMIEHDIERIGGKIEYATGDINGDDPEKEFMRGMLHLFAAYENRRTSVRTSSGMLYRQANGERMTHESTLPIGMTIDPENPKRMIQSPGEQRAISAMRRWKAKGCSIREIAKRLNERPDRYPPRRSRWHPTTVQRVLAKSA